MTKITTEDLKSLAGWDTPTICNALEITNPERRGYGFSVKPFVCLDPSLPPIVGVARTVQIRAAQPPSGSDAGNRMPYYEYIGEGELPKVVVIEDIDPQPGIGAFWGEVNTAVHKGLGTLGVVTNGSIRDLPDSAPNFQALGGMVNPSHAFVHPVAFNIPVNVHGMSAEHNDIIHADQHGAVVVPTDAVKRIPNAIDLISRREAKILAAARAEGFNIDKLKQAIGDAADIH